MKINMRLANPVAIFSHLSISVDQREWVATMRKNVALVN